MESHTRGKCSLVTDVAPQGLQVQTKGKVSKHNSYVKTVSINGNESQGLIDTGCSVCLIRSSSAIQCGENLKSLTQPLFVVKDMSTSGAAAIEEMTADICISQVYTKDNKMLVVPDKAIRVEVLIGHDWLNLPIVNYYKCTN